MVQSELPAESGQLKLPNGPGHERVSCIKTYLFQIFELNLITQSILEMIYSLVTRF